jgi:hypothetical protein
MLQLPNVVGLIVCEQAIIEEKTRNVTLVNCVSRIRCPSFPSPPQRLVVHVALTDGMGDAMMALVVSRLDTLEEMYDRPWPMRFPDPLRGVRWILRPPALIFPAPGPYQISLFADGEWLAQTVLQVSS